jgi:predicted nuclease of restriction endonuclease-like (RecB) superfamily
MQARMACLVETKLAKKRKANLGKASVAPITELATRSTSAKGASADTPAKLFIEDVRAILRQARRGAYAAANHIMVQAYWNIGRRIVREEQGGKQRADYGQFLIRNLARQLGDEFGGGVSVANLKNFRQFYIEFPNFRKGYALRSLLTWTHWRVLMRVEDPDARDFYIRESAENGWKTRQLERNIATHYFQRLLKPRKTSKDKKRKILKPTAATLPLGATSPVDFVKDPYVLEFLGLPDLPSLPEEQLENAITLRLRDFLMELGKGFSFVGRQFRVSTETSHFFVDLVFYNYLLKCFVLIDLKTRALNHADIGQMDMYVRLFDDLKRGEQDNPTLGIILCAHKDDTMVRYSVLSKSQQLFASQYRLVLPSEEELRDELCRRNILHGPEDKIVP